MGQHGGDTQVEREEEIVAVDASVVAKWFVEEEHTDKALQLRDDYVSRAVEIASLDLLPFEVLNALRYNPDLGEDELKRAARALEGYSLWLFPLSAELAERSLENALRYGITIYDSAYISLGEVRGIPVYTADQRLIKKAGDQTLRHISKYKRKMP